MYFQKGFHLGSATAESLVLEVVDAGHGQIALFNTNLKSFVEMTGKAHVPGAAARSEVEKHGFCGWSRDLEVVRGQIPIGVVESFAFTSSKECFVFWVVFLR